jgi:hypothetical protein
MVNIMKFPLVERKAVLRRLVPDSNGWIGFADHVEEKAFNFNVVSSALKESSRN